MKRRFTLPNVAPQGVLPGISRFLSKALLLTFLVAGLAIMTGRAWGQTDFTSPGTTTYVVPGAGTVTVTVECWGGGGQGGGSTNAGTGVARTGGGGAGGAYASRVYNIAAGSTITVTVGSGGSGGGAGASGNGGALSQVLVGALPSTIAQGGAGGTGNTTGGSPAGGLGSTSSSSGTVLFAGGNGGNGATAYGAFIGGGGQGGNGGGLGASSTNVVGSTYNGRSGVAPLGAGTNPGTPGGGGSGSRTSQNSGSMTGGSGGNGLVRITVTSGPAPSCQNGLLTLNSGNNIQGNICFGQPISTINYTIGGGATGAQVTGIAAPMFFSVTPPTVTIWGSPNVGTITYTITTTGTASPCTEATATGTLTVDPLPTVSFSGPSVICMGSTTNVLPSTGGSWTSLSPGTATVTDAGLVTGLAAGSATLTFTELNTGCQNSLLVTVDQAATITLTSASGSDNQQVCRGGAISPITYTFGGSAGTATLTSSISGLVANIGTSTIVISGTPNPSAAPGTYTYTVTTNEPAGPCPAVSLTGFVTLFAPATLTLTSGGVTGPVCQWSAINTVYTFGGGATSATISFNPANVGLAGTLSGTTLVVAGSISETATFTVTTNDPPGPCPAVSLSGSISVVPAPILILTSAPGTDNQKLCGPGSIVTITYYFDGGANEATVEGIYLDQGLSYKFTDLSPTPGQTITIWGSVSETVNYRIYTGGATAPCLNKTVTGTITVNPIPANPVITGPADVCAGSTVTYTASGTGVTYNWLITGGAGSSVTNSISVTWGAAGAGTLSVTYTDINGCHPVSPGLKSVTKHALPVPTITGPNPVCSGSTTAYTTEAGMTGYIWTVAGATATSTLANTITVTWDGAGTGTLTVNYTDSWGCSAAPATTKSVTINPAATLSLKSASANRVICSGTNISPAIVYQYGGGATGAIVTFNPVSPSMTYSAVGGLVTITGTVTSLTATTVTYTVTTTGTLTPCTSIALTGTITVNPLPIPTITGPSLVCSGSTTVYTTQAGMTLYVWTVAGATATSTLGNTITVTWGSGPGTLSVTYTDGNGCTPLSPAVKNVTMNPAATLVLLTANDNQKLCGPGPIAPIRYLLDGGATGAIVTGITPPLYYSVGTVDPKYIDIYGSVLVTTTYTITTTGALSPCQDIVVTGTITVNPVPVVSINSAEICMNTTTNVLPSIGGTWTSFSPGTATVTNAGLVTGLTAGTATLMFTADGTGCTNTTSVTVRQAATLVLTLGNDNQTLCVGFQISPITYTFGGSATTASLATSSGLIGTVSGTTFTVSGTPGAPGTYTYTVTTNDPAGPCTAVSKTGTITVNQSASLSLTSGGITQPVCQWSNINMVYTFGGGATSATVTFNPANVGLAGTLSGTTLVITGSISQTATYTVTTNDPPGPCDPTSLSGSITVVPAPILVLTSASGTDNQKLCGPGPIVTITYFFDGGANSATVEGIYLNEGLQYRFTDLSPNPGQIITIWGSVSQTVNYRIYTGGATAPCLDKTVTGTITVNPIPANPVITGPADVCAGSTITYTASGTGVTYNWLVTGGSGSSVTNSISVTWGAAGAGTLSVTYTDNKGCVPVSPGLKSVTKHALPVPTITGPTPVCSGSTTGYTTEAGMTGYVWTVSGATATSTLGNTITVTWGTGPSGNLTVNYVDAWGCSAAVPTPKSVTINPAATLSLKSGNTAQSICSGINISPIVYQYGGGATGATVTFNPTSTSLTFSAVGGLVTITGTVTSLTATTVTYTVTTTGTTSPCASLSLSGTITVKPLPVPTIGGPTTVCELSSVMYTTEAGKTGYIWNAIGGTASPTTGSANTTVTWGSGATGTVTVIYTDVNGCTATPPTAISVVINKLSTITLTSAVGTDNQKICLGQPIVPITYLVNRAATGLDVIGLEPGLDFDIEDIQTGYLVTITGTATGAMTAGGYGLVTYTITTDGSLEPCSEVLARGTITIKRIPTFTACPDNIVTVDDQGQCTALVNYTATAIGSADLTYSYVFAGAGATESPTGSGTGSGSNFKTGTTTVTVTATNSCGTKTCVFTVKVTDNQMPQLGSCGPHSANTNPGLPTYTVLGAGWNTTGSDNCTSTLTYSTTGATPATGSTLSGTAFSIGAHNVVWTITDASGNAISCTSVVTISDTEKPVIACKIVGTATRTSDPGVCTYTVKGDEFDLLSSSDNSLGTLTKSYKVGTNGAWVVASTLNGVVLPGGSTSITWQVTDPSGNPEFCSFTVTILDNQKPRFDWCGKTFTITLKPTIVRNRFGVFISATGYLYDSMVRPHWTDNCTPQSGLVLTYSRSTTFTDTDGGSNLVRVYCHDAAGNWDSCCVIVEVPLPFKSGQIGSSSVIGEAYSDMGITVYPNPTKGKVYIDIQNLNDPNVMAKVYSMTGALIYSKQVTTDRLVEIDLSGNVSGMYMLQVTADKREFIHKIILDNK